MKKDIVQHGGLFSGIGGFDQAAKWCKWINVFHCEINPFCRQILKYYFPKVSSYEDIRKTDFSSYRGKIDVLTGGGYPANHTVLPEKGWEKMMSATCGRQCLERLSKSDHVGSWAKMFSELLVGMIAWYSRKCTLTWKLKVAKFNRMYFRLLPSVRLTGGTGYGLLPTVLASEGMGRGEIVTSRTKTKPSGKSYWARLSDLAISGLLPTPTAISDSKGGCRHIDRPQKATGDAGGCRSWNYRNPWKDFPSESPICTGNDGFPAFMDTITFSKWRRESIKAAGNAIVPQIAYRIFQVIQLFIDQENRTK